MSASRITSIDLVRGVVMILMAIDHVRVYAGVPAGGPSPGVFFTRWITHFVAPAFLFLAGTSAYLHGRKLADRAALSKYLLVRGLWLVLLELTIIRVAWTFNFDFGNYLLAGVIWVIGWCMILMAAAVHLPMIAIATIGIAIVALHNVTNFIGFGDSEPNWFLKILYFGGEVNIGGAPLLVLFVIVPWIGVMMCGYAFGHVMESERRASICMRLGIALTLLFIVLRATGIYGDPRPWTTDAPPLMFLATTKYPASLSFLLMTLGPMLILLSLTERWRSRLLETFGRVPFFYYLLHIPVIHIAACVVSLIREGRVNPWLFGNHPMAPPPVPDGYMWSLGLLYLVFAICVAVLYVPCRWFARVRATRRSAWLSYL
jgi:uncharacterized membrane protein